MTLTHQLLLLLYGLLLAAEISGITILTTLSTHWEQTNHKHCHFFIHFQVVTPHHNSMERKKSVWDARKSYPCITASFFAQIFSNPFKLITTQSEVFKDLERFTCIIYDKTTEHSSVNGLRQELFSRHSKLIENIPPTQVKKLSL